MSERKTMSDAATAFHRIAMALQARDLLARGIANQVMREAVEKQQLTDVQIKEITEEDARAEGVEPLRSTRKVYPSKYAADVSTQSYRDGFSVLWDEINGERAPWASNPFVWRVEFKRVEVEARAA